MRISTIPINGARSVSNSLSESHDYGFNLSESIRGKIQDLLGQLYDYFTKGVFNGESVTGIAGKFGILRKANLSKTTDYSSRLIISAPELKVENMEDMMVDLDYTAVPLSSICANYYPYMIFYMRRFFENNFTGAEVCEVYDKKSKKILKNADFTDYLTQFNDERLKEELDRYAHGIANRFRAIEIIDKDKKEYQAKINIYKISKDEYDKLEDKTDYEKFPMEKRVLTWCDLIYMAAVEVVKDKLCLITRYPMDTYFNQFPTKVRVSSTNVTESAIVNGVFYPFYPKITDADIGTDTSNRFIDTMQICNLYLESIGGDYDGDQVSCKSLYSLEANKELEDQLNSKKHYIDLSGQSILETIIEGIQSIYNLTIILPDDLDKLSDPQF